MPILNLEKEENFPILDEHTYVNSRNARSNFSRLIKSARFKNARVVITDHGEPAAAIVSVEDLVSLDEQPELAWLDEITETEFKEMTLSEVREKLGRKHVPSNKRGIEDANSS